MRAYGVCVHARIQHPERKREKARERGRGVCREGGMRGEETAVLTER